MSDPAVAAGGAGAPESGSRLKGILEYNKEFVERKGYEAYRRPMPKNSPKAVIVTCMDTRLVRLLPPALDIHEGDAKIIKNAGAVITHPFGGIMRSIIVALYELNANEVFVIGHHDCGMGKIDPGKTVEKMMAAGISTETLATLEYAGIKLKRWLHGFDSVHDSVRNSVDVIRRHPLVPPSVPVHGLIIHPETGALDLVVDGTKYVSDTPSLFTTFKRRMSEADAAGDAMDAAEVEGGAIMPTSTAVGVMDGSDVALTAPATAVPASVSKLREGDNKQRRDSSVGDSHSLHMYMES